MSLKHKTWRPGRWTEAGMLVALMTAALFFRTVRLDAVPPGMTHDEAAYGAEAEQVLAGARPVYFSLGYGHEPLYAYAVALAFRLLGRSLTVMRITSALAGTLAVLFAYLVARRVLGPGWMPWLAAATMAVALWPISISRQALRAITLASTWLPAAWLFWVGVERSEAGGDAPPPYSQRFLPFLLGGACLGLSIYTYMASRVTWLVFPAWALVLLLRKETRRLLARIWPGLLAFLLVAALVALPLARYLVTHPEAEKRVGNMMGPLDDLLQGKPQRVLRHAWNAVRIFSWEGDPFWAYNIPGRPIFGLLGSIVFYLGMAAALWRWADPRRSFVLVWFGVGMIPAMLTTNEGAFVRALIAQPATYALLALGVGTVGQGFTILGRRLALPRRWPTAATLLLAAALVAIDVVDTVRVYLTDWPSRPQVRTIYNHNLVALSRHVRDAGIDLAGVSALYPLYYHDPWLYRYVAGRDERAVRWFDGRGCIVYPGTSGSGLYAFSEEAPLHPTLYSEFAQHAARVERVELAADDENPYFELWDWQGGQALQANLEQLAQHSPMWVSPEIQFAQPELRRALDEPPIFGDVMALVGYQVLSHPEGRVRPGDTLELVTYWRALRTVEAEDDWNTFLHLLDAQSTLIGGTDVLHCPPTGWLPGDVAVQVHSLRVAENAPAGEAYLEIGVYRRNSGRIPAIVDGQPVGDRVLLRALQVQ